MRIATTVLLLFVAVFTSAQNWALLNPAYRYNYSNDGTDTISNQIRVMHIDTLGVDSFRYELNLIGVPCSTCGTGQTAECFFGADPVFARSNAPQFLGDYAKRYSTTWELVGDTSLAVRTDRMIGSSWLSTNGSIATVFIVDTATVLASLDSVKWIAYSNGDTLQISKDHGLVRSSGPTMGGSHFVLIGSSGAMVEGEQTPSYLDLFDYQLGDVLQYHGTMQYIDGLNSLFDMDDHTKYTILQRTDLPDSTAYSARVVRSAQTACTLLSSWMPCGTTYSHTIDTVSFGIRHHAWSQGNLFNLFWNSGLWPNAVGQVYFPDAQLNQRAILSMRKDVDSRYVVEQLVLDGTEDSPDRTVYCRSQQDSTLLHWSYNVMFFSTFTEGVGLTREALYYFEGGSSRELEGSMLSGVLNGTVYSDGVLLRVPELASSSFFRITPNPASDFILLSSSVPGSTCSIADLHGRTLRQHRITSTNECIDVHALPPGVYVLTMEGLRPQRFVIAR